MSVLRRIAPYAAIRFYHRTRAYAAAVRYRFPSRRMIVIGVTGTRGKTTTANYLWSVFTAAGYRAGLSSTANIRVGNDEVTNPYHMTMPGKGIMQRILAGMAHAACEVAIVETPSEGIEQSRHIGIAYDILVAPTLYPEELATHGRSYDRLKDRIEELFVELATHPRKKLRGVAVPKAMILGTAITERDRFFRHPADVHRTYGIEPDADVRAEKIVPCGDGVSFQVGDERYSLSLVGSFNVPNALAAITVGSLLGLSQGAIRAGLSALQSVPGRMERIVAGQPFTVFVDYAHDGPSMEAAMTAAREIAEVQRGRVIVHLGAEGGGRDIKKRPVMGRLAARLAHFIVVGNVDPYDDDPMPIIEDIAKGCEEEGAKRGDRLFVIEDRREGIRKCLTLARAGDVVLITGKGAEQSMILGPTTIPWDDRTVVREELSVLSS